MQTLYALPHQHKALEPRRQKIQRQVHLAELFN